MTTDERERFVKALLSLKCTVGGTAGGIPTSLYDQFVALHWGAVRCMTNLGFASPGAMGGVRYHSSLPSFVAWHRELLFRFEDALRSMPGCADVTLPYVDFTNSDGTFTGLVLTDAFLGAPGAVTDFPNALTGYCSSDPTAALANPSVLPEAIDPLLMPSGTWEGFRARPSLNDLATDAPAADPAIALATAGSVVRGEYAPEAALSAANVRAMLDATSMSAFLAALNPLHAAMHNLFGNIGSWDSNLGNLGGSPNDPLFWLLHCTVDFWWAMWQMDGHEGTLAWSAGGPPGPGTDDGQLTAPLWPWDGGATAPDSSGATAFPADIALPSFASLGVQTVSDTINHREMGGGAGGGYVYDAQVVVGVCVDRSGSMAGPLAAGDVVAADKLEAARVALELFAQNAQVAYEGLLAYVNLGVLSFSSVDGTNETDNVVSSPGYAIVKEGSPTDPDNLVPALSALTADGGTPLAAAVTAGQSQLVEPPFGGQASGETRYLLLLTDGRETASPLLSSLSTGEHPDTLFFGMGFGTGSGWNGVDYATIETLVTKGKDPGTAADRVYHGDTMAVLTKFFNDSFAAAIGLTHLVDPTMTLLPGEYADVPFVVNDTDGNVLITTFVQDLTDAHWSYELLTPAGELLGADARPFFRVSRQRRGCASIVLSRDRAPRELWVGQWTLRAWYQRRHDHHHDADHSQHYYRWLPSRVFLTPAGVRRLSEPAHQARRALSQYDRFATSNPVDVQASGVTQPGQLTVQVYHRGTLKARTHLPRGVLVGRPFEVEWELDGFDLEGVLADGVAFSSGYTLGNLVADPRTIPYRSRRRYGTGLRFNLAAYLADYEAKKPTAFVRKEDRVVLQVRGRKLVARFPGVKTPGIVRFAVRAAAKLRSPRGRVEAVQRVLSASVPVGLVIDPARSASKVRWLAPDRLAFTLTPQDAHGNLVLSTMTSPPELRVGGTPVLCEAVASPSGGWTLEVRLEGHVEGAEHAETCGCEVRFACPGGCFVRVPSGGRLTLSVAYGGRSLVGRVPSWVTARSGKKVYVANSPEALKLRDPVYYYSRDELVAAGLVAPLPSTDHDHDDHDHDDHDHDHDDHDEPDDHDTHDHDAHDHDAHDHED